MPRVTDDYYEKKRGEIIEAAYRVCTKKPIGSVDMKDIIEETGFSHGVIYRYYRELDEVLLDLVSEINRKNKIDGRLESVLGNADFFAWKKTVADVFKMLSDYMGEVGIDVLKISLYSDMLAASDPVRAAKIAERLGKGEDNPLGCVVSALGKYLKKAAKENGLKPSRTVDEIMQFVVASYQGIQTAYVLSECYESSQLKNKYRPKKMFGCLAESVIAMMEGKNE